jgi:hypothetical protein
MGQEESQENSDKSDSSAEKHVAEWERRMNNIIYDIDQLYTDIDDQIIKDKTQAEDPDQTVITDYMHHHHYQKH